MRHLYAAMFAPILVVACAHPTDDAEKAVRGKLTDPGSAQFRNWDACPSGKGWTGEVNAKNAYGGYTGFTDFIYVNGAVGFVSGDTARTYADLMPTCLEQPSK